MMIKEINNRKARYEYRVLDTIECGIVLHGNEVKSIRWGSCSLDGTWASIDKGILCIHGMYIKAWDTTNQFDLRGERADRVLLAHKKEILKLNQTVQLERVTLIPLKLYFNKEQKLKVLLGICQGNNRADKRNNLKLKDTLREIERSFSQNM